MTSVTAAPRAATDLRRVLVVVNAGVLLASLDLFIVNVALADIAADFGNAPIAELSWVLNAYAIAFAALLVPAGRLGDRGGIRATFLLGLALFVLGSALCATAWNVESLVGFRIVQAVGAAVLTPASLGLVLAASPPERRAMAVRLWVAFGGLGAALGPVLGGLLVQADWRLVFLVNVPLGLAALAAGPRVLPAVPGDGGALPDLRGALLAALAVAGLVLGLVQGPEWGWSSPGVLGAFVLAVLCGIGFAVSSARHHSPILAPALLRAPNFALMTGNAVFFNIAFGGMLLSVVLWAQTVWGWSALRTGLAIAPGPLLVPVVAMLAGRLIARVGPGPVIAVGGAVFGAGTLWWSRAVALVPDYAGGLLGGMLLTGVGVGLVLPTSFAVGTGGLPPERFATGSAVLSTARQVGLAVGVAVLVALLGAPAGPGQVLAAFHRAWLVIAVFALLAGIFGLALRRPAPQEGSPGSV